MLPTLDELRSQFDDEETCVEYLDTKGVFYKTVKCHNCNVLMRRVGVRRVLRCSKCRKEIRMRSNTFFQGSHLTCKMILRMAYFWLSKASHKQISIYLGLARQTLTDFIGHFRQLVSSTLEEEDTVIGGEGVVVEIDESKISKRKYNRGHPVRGVWIVGGVEKTTERRIFLVAVQRRDRNTLEEIIRKHVALGSIVRTDLWKGYGFLKEDLDYVHETVNHSLNFKDPATGVHTNSIEGTWAGLKRCIQMRYRTEEGISNHLLEFIWRRKHCNNIWEGFIEALKVIHYDLSE